MSEQQQANVSLAERIFDASMAVERIVHLPYMVAERVDGDLWDWIEESGVFEVIAEELGMAADALDDALNECGDQRRARQEMFQELVTWRLRSGGWLVEGAWPHWRSVGDGASTTGSSRLAVTYGKSYAEAVTKLVEMAEADLSRAMSGAHRA